jgi:hypothetical protein
MHGALFDGSTAIALTPLLPWAMLGPLFGLAALALAAGLLRRAGGVAWRLLALAALALALLNPSLIIERRQAIKDLAVVVVDRSPSQSLGDRSARTDRAVEALTRRLAGFDDLETRVVTAGDSGGDTQAINETRLFEAVSRALADVPRRRVAGVILVTDGQVHDVPAALDKLEGLGPIHTLLTGERNEGDRRLTLVNAPTYGLVGKPVELTIRIDDMPGRQSSEAGVSMRVDGGPTRRLRLPVGQDVQVQMTVGHGGQNVLELEVDAAPREQTLSNNRAAIVINGVRDRLRVLLVSGEPHAGERTWRNLLKSDPAVDLVHFTILRPPDKQDGTPIRELSLISFPIRELFEIKLDEFDLIIFDRYRRQGVLPDLYLENIARYVNNGGALLESSSEDFAGPDTLFNTPLGAVLPGAPTGRTLARPFRPRVSDLGRRHPVTAGLPGDHAGRDPDWGRWFRQVEVRPKGAMTLMDGGDGWPLLMLARVGKGRVAQLSSDQIWLWNRGYDGGGPQAELLRRLAHWLMKEPELEENDLRAQVDNNRITVERRSLDPDPRPVTLTTPSDRKTTLALSSPRPGLETATTVAGEPGIYRIEDGERTALAVVGVVNPPELADVRSTGDRLAPVARATGGGIQWLVDYDRPGQRIPDPRRTRPDRDQSGRDWIGLRANGDYAVTGVMDAPLLPPLAVLLLALGALLAAWRREGR